MGPFEEGSIVYKHKDFGFNFTVNTNAKIPEALVSKFYNRMSSIDKDLIDFLSTFELNAFSSSLRPSSLRNWSSVCFCSCSNLLASLLERVLPLVSPSSITKLIPSTIVPSFFSIDF